MLRPDSLVCAAHRVDRLISRESLPDKQSVTFEEHLRALLPSGSSMSTFTPLSHQHESIRALVPSRRTSIMGIINVTPDSFSDGGLYYGSGHNATALTAKRMADSGASIIDVGGQSTRPGAEDVGEAEELKRVVPLISALEDTSLCISVDTYRARVAEEAIGAGAHMINDISGGTMDPEMLSTVARLGCTMCLAHTRGTPLTMTKLNQYPDGVITGVGKELCSRVKAAEEAGIRRWRIILDPGIGFAKSSSQNLEILRRLPELRAFEGLRNFPWLIGTSRKKFIGNITKVQEPRERTWGTAAAVTAAVAGGADIVRVHDVAEMSQVVKVADEIWRI